MLVKDQLNRTLQFSTTPQRIISLVPSQTELLVDLGLRTSLVGITKFCVHPHTLRKEVTVVGGTKQVHFDKIKELSPDLIICNKEENTEEMVQRLMGIAPVWVSDVSSIDDSLVLIQNLGQLLNATEKATKICAKISSERKRFERFVSNRSPRKVAYLIWKKPYMAAGNDTFIHTLLAYNRFENIVLEKRYPEVTVEILKQADLILLSTEPYPFKEYDVRELQKETNKPVYLVDGEYFSWYGSRLQGAFSYFEKLLKDEII